VLTRGGRNEEPTAGVGVVQADIRDTTALTAVVAPLRAEALCHLAALTSARGSFADPLGYFDVNVTGTINLLRAVTSQNTQPVRVVFASTSAVYGSSRPGKLTEDLEPCTENPYASSKLVAEQLLTYFADTGAVGAVTLRCFNIAGAINGYGDPDGSRIIPASLRVAAGESPDVTVNGDGSATREFTHVLDAADAFRLSLTAVKQGANQIFNLGTGTGTTMLDVIRAAESVTGRPIAVVHRPPANEAHTLIADGRRIRDALAWQPKRSAIETIIRDAWTARTLGDGH
jgi:UDP-glucose 4-epimerase